MQPIWRFLRLFRTSFEEWNRDGAPRLAASLAYYTAFSLAPLLVIVIVVISLVVNQDTVRAEILDLIRGGIGRSAAEFVGGVIDSLNRPGQGFLSTLLGIVALVLGALGVFGNLQAALDQIWGLTPEQRPGGVRALIRNNMLSFSMVLVVGFLLLVSLVISTALSVLGRYLADLLPGAGILMQIVSFAVSLLVITVLFALIFKVLPHVRMAWREVWVGSFVTALLFTLGQTLLALYLGQSGTTSAYGAAGAFVLILLWIYYSAQIVLYGAEFTKVFARTYGSRSAHHDQEIAQPTVTERPSLRDTAAGSARR